MESYSTSETNKIVYINYTKKTHTKECILKNHEKY